MCLHGSTDATKRDELTSSITTNKQCHHELSEQLATTSTNTFSLIMPSPGSVVPQPTPVPTIMPAPTITTGPTTPSLLLSFSNMPPLPPIALTYDFDDPMSPSPVSKALSKCFKKAHLAEPHKHPDQHT